MKLTFLGARRKIQPVTRVATVAHAPVPVGSCWHELLATHCNNCLCIAGKLKTRNSEMSQNDSHIETCKKHISDAQPSMFDFVQRIVCVWLRFSMILQVPMLPYLREHIWHILLRRATPYVK